MQNVTRHSNPTPRNQCLSTYLFQQSKEYICVDGPLVGLIQHDDGILSEVGVNQALSQQHAICHILDDCFWAGAILKSNGVAHLHKTEEANLSTESLCEIIRLALILLTERKLTKIPVVSSSKDCPALNLILNNLMTMKTSLLGEI